VAAAHLDAAVRNTCNTECCVRFCAGGGVQIRHNAGHQMAATDLAMASLGQVRRMEMPGSQSPASASCADLIMFCQHAHDLHRLHLPVQCRQIMSLSTHPMLVMDLAFC
jgi:iron-sulfur cluster repair protein YtfE (RIC family)